MDIQDEFLFHCSELPSRSFCFFADKRSEFCDVTLTVRTLSISAHRIIISAAIPRLYEMFYDKETLGSYELEFPDVDLSAFKALVEFAYTREVKINMENVKPLLSAACFLRVDDVTSACCRYLSDRLHPNNVCDIREYVSPLGCTNLVKEIDCYIREHFQEMSHTSGFLNIPFSVLGELLARDDLNVDTEETTFEVAMKWINHSPEERKEGLPDILRNIRLPLLKPAYIKKHVLKEELIRKSIECRDLLDEVTYNNLAAEEKGAPFPTTRRSVVRSSLKNKENGSPCIYIMHFAVKQAVECLDSTKEKWQATVSHDFDLEHKHAFAELNKKMYYFLREHTYVCDLEKGIASVVKGMAIPRLWATALPHSNKLYIVGGCLEIKESDAQSNVTECFDPYTEEWSELTPMATKRGAPGAVVSLGFMFVLGGRTTGDRYLDSVEKYDFKTGVWSPVSPMLTTRCAFGCASVNDKIYVCGGISINALATSTAEVFDCITNEWKFISSMSTKRYLCKLISFCGELYVLGGSTEHDENLPTVEIYEPVSDQWKSGPTPNGEFPIIAAVVVDLHAV